MTATALDTEVGYWNHTTIRELERASIRAFMEKHRGYLKGRVLDFGAGKPDTCREPQPYRDLVDGEYVPYDVGDNPPAGSFDAVICTQVLQYLELPQSHLFGFHDRLKERDGHLVCSYPTNWDVVENSDLWRFTPAGMELLLNKARFTIVHHELRAEINLGGFRFPLGYGVVARAY